MTANYKIGGLLAVALIALQAFAPNFPIPILGIGVNFREVDAKPLLSDYAFFTGKLSELLPASNVFPYEVNAPLFSDYAEKARFVFLPEGQKMMYDSTQVFEFPVGAVIIKNFFYWTDARVPEKGRHILETRLLLKQENGWKALEYIWNAKQTDAFLEVAGANFPVSWVDAHGKTRSIEYIAPNLNQCKGCHSHDGQFVPIGITARQLNREEKGENQLHVWQRSGRLALPENFDAATAPCLTDYSLPDNELQKQYPNLTADRQVIPISQYHSLRARAYLDANCAHCHNPHGPASTSGLFLEFGQNDLAKLGVGKAPVAAGRGSGNRRFSIVQGKPNESILVFRMESDDPGIRMPELGRQLQHKEGVELIKAWIREKMR